MKPLRTRILTINGGSSSIRFATYNPDAGLRRELHGKIERIGLAGTQLTYVDPLGDTSGSIDIPPRYRSSAATFLIDWLENQNALASVQAVGHRVVHGMHHSRAELITPTLLDELRRIAPYVPEHIPREIALIEAFGECLPGVGQVACFDTAFHATLPRRATLLAVPRRLQSQGVRRYGFHGLSYAYLLEELGRLEGPTLKNGRIILAHLGNGASMAAIRNGQSIDTSMGFTPASGLPMGTRSGDLDPGLVAFLARTEGMSAARFEQMANHESGLIGMSEISADVRDLLACEPADTRAADALAVFCYQAKKMIGAFAAALGGVDALVFTGGIGENAPAIRERIAVELGFLGIEIDRSRNERNAAMISPDSSHVIIRVIRTDEEIMIARLTARIFNLSAPQES